MIVASVNVAKEHGQWQFRLGHTSHGTHKEGHASAISELMILLYATRHFDWLFGDLVLLSS